MLQVSLLEFVIISDIESISATLNLYALRGKHGENRFGNVQYAPWCATFSVLAEDNVGYEERSCWASHFFACSRSMKSVE